MKYVLILAFLMLNACQKPQPGPTGPTGPTGQNGQIGQTGAIGPQGQNGLNGTSNIVTHIVFCGGQVTQSGFWSSLYISYQLSEFTSGDKYISLQVYGLNSFNNSNGVMYSKNQNGSINGIVSLMIDNSTSLFASLNQQNQLVVDIQSSSNPANFVNPFQCTQSNY